MARRRHLIGPARNLMHVISFGRLREFFAEHADAEAPPRRWFKITDKARWSDFAELRASCPSADRVGHLFVIDIGGNKYRLIIEVFFRDQVVLIRRVLTHREYDKGEWKQQAPAPEREAVTHEDAIEEAPRSGEGRKGRGRGPRR
jgi:mRNA interferase HigB